MSDPAPQAAERCVICADDSASQCGKPGFLRELKPCRVSTPTVPTTTPWPSRGSNVAQRLQGVLTTMAKAPTGRRNDTLHWCACRVGEMLAVGELRDTHPAVDVLAQVAETTGLLSGEIDATIRSGLGKYGVRL